MRYLPRWNINNIEVNFLFRVQVATRKYPKLSSTTLFFLWIKTKLPKNPKNGALANFFFGGAPFLGFSGEKQTRMAVDWSSRPCTWQRLCISVVLFCIVFQLVDSTQQKLVKIEKLDRTIDLSKSYVTEKVVMKLNTAKWDAFELLVPFQQYEESLAHIQVEDSSSRALQVKEQPERDVLYRKLVVLPNASTSVSDTIKVTLIYMNCLKPKPQFIPSDGDQFLYYENYVRFHSPYEVEEQKTTITFPQSQIQFVDRESIPELSISGKKAYLGPYKKVKPKDSLSFGVRFLHNIPLVTGNQVTKTVKVSHWGWLQVHESYELENKAAKVKGGVFSRLDYQLMHYKQSAEKVVARLPLEARDVTYKDYVGNITSSHLRDADRSKIRLLQLEFRYPLIGGWKNAFFIGYRVPIRKYLDALGSSRYQLRVGIAPSISSSNVVLDHYLFRVALPQGAKNISWRYSSHFVFDEMHHETLLDILDTRGRPVLVFEKRKMVPNSMAFGSLVITYELGVWSWLEKMLLPVGFFMVLLTCISLASRFRFRETNGASNHSVYGNQLYSLHIALSDTYQEAIDTFSKMKGTLTPQQFQSSYSSVHHRLKEYELQLEHVHKSMVASLGNSKLATLANQLADIYKTKHDIFQRWYSTTRSKLGNVSSVSIYLFPVFVVGQYFSSSWTRSWKNYCKVWRQRISSWKSGC